MPIIDTSRQIKTIPQNLITNNNLMKQNQQTTSKADTWFDKGLAAQDQGELHAAITAYLKALDHYPEHFAATYNLANLYNDTNQLDLARQQYIKAIKTNPTSALPYKGLGDLLFNLNETEQALFAYKQAIKMEPGFAEAWHNIGLIEQHKQNSDKALNAYRQAVTLKPNYKNALDGLTTLSRYSGITTKTIAFLSNLNENTPHNQHLKLALAEMLRDNQSEESLALINSALAIDKTNGEAFNQLGMFYLKQGKSKTARLNFKKACELTPESPKINSNLLYSCISDPETTPEEYLQEAGYWWRRHGAHRAAETVFNHQRSLTDNRPLRLGFISGDFRRHSVSYFFLPLINNLDTEKFITYGYSDTWEEDDFTQKIKEQTTNWRTIYGLGDKIVAEIIATDKIDILVELAGHTSNNRLTVIARQPVPIQFSWLGYPASTGIPNKLYRLSDQTSDPKDYQKHYSELLSYIDPLFLSYMPAPEAENLAIEKKHPSKNSLVFASCNNAVKINQKVIEIWAEILRRLPTATLLFKTRTLQNKTATDLIRKRFSDLGIASEQVVIDNKNYSSTDHFKSYNRIDIALDSFPYNGTTTTCDALWMGIPVICLKGNTHAARVGMTLMKAIGCPELIAQNERDYIEKAVNLAQNPDQLAEYHVKIRSLMQNSALMDASGFTQSFSRAILNRWEAWRSQQLNIFNRLIDENKNILALPPGFTELLSTNPAATTLLQKTLGSYRDLHLFVKLGQKYANEERLDEACICFRKAVAEDKDNAIYRYVLANILQRLEQNDEALYHYRTALELDPQRSDAAIGLSSILRKQDKNEAALEILLNALKQLPTKNDVSKINVELANIYYNLHRLEEAYESLCNCLISEPKQAGIWSNIGYLMAESGKSEKAAECYSKALLIDPDLIAAQNNLMWQQAQNCSWTELTTSKKECKVLPPFTSIFSEPDPKTNLKSAQNFHNKSNKEIVTMSGSHHLTHKKDGIIKIGYLSCDFRNHPVAHNMINLFRLHDRSRFHVTAYSCGKDDGSKYRRKISKDCDDFVDLQKLNDFECAKKINADETDILIELMGHTRENKFGILAYRPAPIQVSYLGFPGTTGAKFIDY
ncbi:MAG: tetratricopeptide repeat protein, partial [Kiritimatiellae bacterium]|nr:tetratricopeptide repeat protein [Kiritimatiellia bacterium]